MTEPSLRPILAAAALLLFSGCNSANEPGVAASATRTVAVSGAGKVTASASRNNEFVVLFDRNKSPDGLKVTTDGPDYFCKGSIAPDSQRKLENELIATVVNTKRLDVPTGGRRAGYDCKIIS